MQTQRLNRATPSCHVLRPQTGEREYIRLLLNAYSRPTPSTPSPRTQLQLYYSTSYLSKNPAHSLLTIANEILSSPIQNSRIHTQNGRLQITTVYDLLLLRRTEHQREILPPSVRPARQYGLQMPATDLCRWSSDSACWCVVWRSTWRLISRLTGRTFQSRRR